MKTFYRWMFLVGGTHNFLGGLGFVVLYDWVYNCCGHQPPDPGIHYQMWIAMIFLFGVAYLLVWRDPYGSRKLVAVAILGKFLTAAVLGYALVAHASAVPTTFAVPVASDFAWGVLFTGFYAHASSNDLWARRLW